MTSKTYNWTTPRGAKVELTITEGMVEVDNYADGWGVKTEEFQREITGFKLNGNAYSGEFNYHNGQRVVLFKVGSQKTAVALPKEITEQIFAREKAKVRAMLDADEKYQREHDAIKKMMAE